MKPRAELYLDHLDGLIGAEPRFGFFGLQGGPLPRMTSIIYVDQPEDGLLTAFTYGLSLADHPDWKAGAPELVLCVESGEPAWGWAVAEVAARLRGQCPFCIGDTINFRERIAEESAMSAFFVFFPTVLDREAATVKLPDRPVHIVEMYPIYEGEIGLIRRIGPVAFWDLDGFDPYAVHRPDLSLISEADRGEGRAAMTESEWSACDDPTEMLRSLRDGASDRKLRLLAMACCRRIWHLLEDKRSRTAVEAVGQFAEGQGGDDELRSA